MNEQEVYDFCLDWMVDQVSKKDLCREFVDKNWQFSIFHQFAIIHGWFTNSMSALIYAEEFSK